MVQGTNWVGLKANGSRGLCLIKEFTNNYRQKRMSPRILLHVSAENVDPIHDEEKFGNRREFQNSSHLRIIVNFKTSLKSPSSSSEKNRRAHFDAATPEGPVLQQVQTTMNNEIKVHPQNFKGSIIFMSMYHDIDRTQKNHEDTCRQNSTCPSASGQRFPYRELDFSRPPR